MTLSQRVAQKKMEGINKLHSFRQALAHSDFTSPRSKMLMALIAAFTLGVLGQRKGMVRSLIVLARSIIALEQVAIFI